MTWFFWAYIMKMRWGWDGRGYLWTAPYCFEIEKAHSTSLFKIWISCRTSKESNFFSSKLKNPLVIYSNTSFHSFFPVKVTLWVVINMLSTLVLPPTNTSINWIKQIYSSYSLPRGRRIFCIFIGFLLHWLLFGHFRRFLAILLTVWIRRKCPRRLVRGGQDTRCSGTMKMACIEVGLLNCCGLGGWN